MTYLQVFTDLFLCLPSVAVGLVCVWLARKKSRAFFIGTALCALLTLLLLADAALLLLGYGGLF
ncbi:MAG: hypothetical protein PHO66_02335 [Eubacteriales bacterium]|nr:hypothetical protein [Eubacteriales bacterium]